MSQRALPPSGIVVVFSRPSDFAREQEWSAWYAGSHLPATADASSSGIWVEFPFSRSRDASTDTKDTMPPRWPSLPAFSECWAPAHWSSPTLPEE